VILDLFGNEVDPRTLHRKTTVQRGHAWAPGTGPAGETCGSCAHIHRGRRWFKCYRSRKRWTGGKATDVRARDAACKFWERAEQPQN
jgi:hypothetical protein